MQNGLSVDVEDWFQVGAFERTIDRADWPALECRVEANCDAVLQIFAEAKAKGTFFTLGWVAERYPALIKRIVGAGHELASHGYDHRRVFSMTADEFAADLKKTRAILEDLGGVAIRGYRAPSFSVDARTSWAHPVLAEQGYAYSSSVAPVVHDHYGWPQSPRHAWRPVTGSDLVEWPVIQTVKCLCSYHPNDPAELKREQEETLVALYDACRTVGRELLVEIIAGKNGPLTNTTVSGIIERLYGLGIKPALYPFPVPILRGALTLAGRQALFDRLCGSLQVDISHARDVLGWSPAVTPREGLRLAVK